MAIWAHLPVFKWQLSGVWVSFCLDGSCTLVTNDLALCQLLGTLGFDRKSQPMIIGMLRSLVS